jgi:hypothetical protein
MALTMKAAMGTQNVLTFFDYMKQLSDQTLSASELITKHEASSNAARH